MHRIIMIITTLSLFLYITPSLASHTTSAPPQALKQPRAVSYFSAEGQQTALNLLTKTTPPFAPIHHLDLIIIAFANIIKDPHSGHYTLQFGYNPKITQQITKIIRHQKKINTPVLLSIYSDNDFPLKTNPDGKLAILEDPQFTSNVIRFLKQHHLQGIDLDLEACDQTENIKDIVTALAPALHRAHDLLSVSVLPITSLYSLSPGKNNEFNQADFTSVQNYFSDFNLPSFTQSMQDWHQTGIPYNKLLGGINCDGANVGQTHTAPSLIRQWSCWARDAVSTADNHCTRANLTRENASSHLLAGMYSWRVDNDNSTGDLDITPTFASTNSLTQLMHNPISHN